MVYIVNGECDKMKILSKKQVNEIIDRVSNEQAKTFLKIYILAHTGVRVSELLRIKPCDILTDERQIIIRGKRDVIRNVDVTPELLLPLRLYIKQKHIKDNELIFPVTRQSVYDLCKKYAGVSPHKFRHTYIANLLRTTKNIRYVEKQAGHKDIRTTRIYLQFMEFEEDKKKLGELYS